MATLTGRDVSAGHYDPTMDESRRSGAAAPDVSNLLSRHASQLYDDSRLMPMLRQLLRGTCQLAGAVGGSVSLVDSDAGRYTKIAELGTACQLGQSFPLDEGVTGHVVERRAPVVLASYRGIRSGHLKAGHPAWDGAVAAIPIWWRADIVAVNVIFVGAARQFSTGEVDGLELVTQVVAPGLVSAVERELPDRAPTRRRDVPWLDRAAPESSGSDQSLQEVVSGLVDLAQRASGSRLDPLDSFEVRVLPGDARHRLLVRPDRAAAASRAGSEGWQELLDSSGTRELVPVYDTVGSRDGASGEDNPFTAREREVVSLLARGLSDRAIATDLCLSPKTVEKHVSAVLRKSGTTSRTAAVVRCMERHWLS